MPFSSLQPIDIAILLQLWILTVSGVSLLVLALHPASLDRVVAWALHLFDEDVES